MRGAILWLLCLPACSLCEGPKPTYIDQCLRQEIFMKCLNTVPEGPTHVVGNDWDEVVRACESAAYYQSLRKTPAKPECAL